MIRKAYAQLAPPKFVTGSCIYEGFENVPCDKNSYVHMYTESEVKRCKDEEYGVEIPVGTCRFILNKK